MKKIPVIICIDVEPDLRAIDPNAESDWVGFEKTLEFFRELRPRLEQVTGSPAHFSWFVRMDPQIAHTYGFPAWPVTRYRRLFDYIAESGDEIGLHVHAWRWDTCSNRWIADMGDQEWVEQCIRMSFEAFEQSLARSCRSFRFGDHWINDATLDLVEELGAWFDLTTEPGLKRPKLPDECVGSGADFEHVPR